MRQEAGIETVGWDYRQCGLVLTIEHEFPHHGVAEERFLAPGPFATLPLPGNRSTLVWTERPERAQELMQLSHDEVGRELASRLNPRLGKLVSWSPLQSWPLLLQLARQLTAERLALVGDAAHVVHPLAGLGFNLGIKDTAALAEVVIDAARAGGDIGAPDVLERYAQWRRADTLSVIAATEFLNRLFSNDSSALKLLRDTGLKAVDRLAPLKGAFVREAAGLSGAMPKLLTAQPL
jgi:2-octaprenyl-6-methoxyphenol hydroxylase